MSQQFSQKELASFEEVMSQLFVTVSCVMLYNLSKYNMCAESLIIKREFLCSVCFIYSNCWGLSENSRVGGIGLVVREV